MLIITTTVYVRNYAYLIYVLYKTQYVVAYAFQQVHSCLILCTTQHIRVEYIKNILYECTYKIFHRTLYVCLLAVSTIRILLTVLLIVQ